MKKYVAQRRLQQSKVERTWRTTAFNFLFINILKVYAFIRRNLHVSETQNIINRSALCEY